jgi:glycosyltransferase involved in cell wall biosynthesis
MVNHPDCEQFHGGDLVALRKTAEALRAVSVEVVESHDPAPNAAGFDVAHVFNLRTYEATGRQVEALHRAGVPIVLTPFYITTGHGEWAWAALRGIFLQPRADAERRALLERYRSRQLSVTLADGTVLKADAYHRPGPALQQQARAILSRVDCLLPNSLLELDQLRKDLSAADAPFAVIPLGADVAAFDGPDPEPFVRRYHVRDFVLQVGRIEPMKNQLGLVHALRDLDAPVVLVGQPMSQEYIDACRYYGPRKLTILSYLPPEELRAAYAAARVHALANWTEVCGLVSMEAALAGCSIVCGTAGHELAFYGDLAYYCDPTDHDSIRRAVVRALTNYAADGPRRQALRDRILREFTWPRVAEMTLAVYRSVLAARRSR